MILLDQNKFNQSFLKTGEEYDLKIASSLEINRNLFKDYWTYDAI